jgi:hypothetical protein
LKPFQWGSRREIYGLHEKIAVLQYRYKCNNGQCGKTLTAAEMLKTDGCPELVRLHYSTIFLTENSGVTEEVLQIIMEGGVSKQSFDDIEMLLRTLRQNRYMRDRTMYEVCIDHYCQKSGCRIEDMPPFSAQDDPAGYNVSNSDLTSEFIIQVFRERAATLKPFMENAFESQVPCTVLTIDHTYNVAEKTVDFVPCKEPEYLPAGTEGRPSYGKGDKKTLLIVLGADNKVCTYLTLFLATLFLATLFTTYVILGITYRLNTIPCRRVLPA